MNEKQKKFLTTSGIGGLIIVFWFVLAVGSGQYMLTWFLPLINPTVERVAIDYGLNAFMIVSLGLSAMMYVGFFAYGLPTIVVYFLFRETINCMIEDAEKAFDKEKNWGLGK